MTWAEMVQADLRESATYAADFLREALADDEPRTLVGAVGQVIAARGSLKDVELTHEELSAIVERLYGQTVQLPHAA